MGSDGIAIGVGSSYTCDRVFRSPSDVICLYVILSCNVRRLLAGKQITMAISAICRKSANAMCMRSRAEWLSKVAPPMVTAAHARSAWQPGDYTGYID